MSHDPAIMSILELLAARWPACFRLHQIQRRPLKVGIYADVLAALDGAITPSELNRALACYVANKIYRSRLVAGAVRIGLDGEPAGVVTPEQATPQKIERKPQEPINKPKSVPPQRLSFADLREAAQRRKAAAVS